MEQAVFFGDRPENPLSFDAGAASEGDVADAAETVSAEILACSESTFLMVCGLGADGDRLGTYAWDIRAAAAVERSARAAQRAD
jgi:hypothetical protein